MKNTPTGKRASRSTPKSPSWIVERDAIRLFGDRKTRAILAIYHARRSAKKAEFFVHPDIAKVNGLSPSQLNWALGELEGVLIETLDSKKGRYRTIRLLPQFDDAVADSEGGAAAKVSIPSPAVAGEERVHIDTAEVLAGLAKERM
jgi:hypothetical protein